MTLTSTLELDSFRHLCKILYLKDATLDVISLHVKLSDLIFYALSFLEEYECETVGQ
jgi:mediator of RNA polymerase II transcription subunit 5